MGFLDLFKPVSTWSTEEVREFIRNHSPEDYHLVDVRQPAEYEREHLPGARLIPVEKLEERLEELDRGKPVIVY